MPCPRRAVVSTDWIVVSRPGYPLTEVRLAPLRLSPPEMLRKLNVMLLERKIDLLLCDLSLEKQENGFDVIEFARRKDPGMPAVLLTGYATQDSTDRADKCGIPIFFKPIRKKFFT